MHDIMPPVGAGAQLIQSYGAAGFRIGNVNYTTHVLVLPTQTTEWNGAMTMEGLAHVLTADPAIEVLLIGTGARHEMIAPELRTALRTSGIAIDTMDTGAACRTFNILLGEGRRAAVALRLVG
jgi:uncharacterized protein